MSGGAASDGLDDTDIPKRDLLEAAYEGNQDRVRELILSGVPVDSEDDDGVTALHIAAFMGNEKMLAFLLNQNADIERASVVGMTALHHACREGKMGVLDMLLQRGATIDKETGMGATPLTLAAAGCHTEIVKKLLSLRVDVQPVHGICPTPLIAAAFRSSPHICGCLTKRGARVDYVMESLFGLSALSCTIMCASPRMISALLDLGANPKVQALKKMSAFKLAEQFRKRDGVMEVLMRNSQKDGPVRDVREFIENGNTTDPSFVSQLEITFAEGATCLMHAICTANVDAVRDILMYGASPRSVESRLGLSPLQIASILRQDDICAVLLAEDPKLPSYLNNQSMSAHDYYITCYDEPNQTLRSALHPHRPREQKINLNSSTSSLASFTRPKNWMSRVSSQLLLTERQSEPSAMDAWQLKMARLAVNPMVGRNHKKLVLLEDLLRESRNLSPCKSKTFDSEMDVVKGIAQECSSFMIDSFFDLYNSTNEDKGAGPVEVPRRLGSDYDIALINSNQYGYQTRQRVNPRDSFHMHRREASDSIERRRPRPLSIYEPPPQSSRTTPRMLKKGRDEDRLLAGTDSMPRSWHEPLRKQSSTPQLIIPTVMSSPNQPRHARSLHERRKSQMDMLTDALYDRLRSLQLYDVIRQMEEAEIDGVVFLSMKNHDFHKIGISSPETIRRLVDIQSRMDNTHYIARV